MVPHSLSYMCLLLVFMFTLGTIKHVSMSSTSTSVSSSSSLSNHPLVCPRRFTSVTYSCSLRHSQLSSTGSSLIPEHIRTALNSSHNESPLPLSSNFPHHLSDLHEPQSAPLSHSQPWSTVSHHTANDTDNRRRVSSPLSEPAFGYNEDEGDDGYDDSYDYTIRKSIPAIPHTAPVTRAPSSMRSPSYAIATPRPTLLFAIASDDVEQVQRVLKNGNAGPNDLVGPQSALAFTLTNDQLTHKMDIVKTLLAFGADPTELKNPELNPPHRSSGSESDDGNDRADMSSPSPGSLLDRVDPATRYVYVLFEPLHLLTTHPPSYYIARAEAAHTRRMSVLIHRSFFRPLTRLSYELIGQDRALEQLFRVLSIHSQQLSLTPIVVLLCGMRSLCVYIETLTSLFFQGQVDMERVC